MLYSYGRDLVILFFFVFSDFITGFLELAL